MSKEAIQKGIDALRGVIAWDIMRNHLIPYRVRDPIHEAIEALASLAERPAPTITPEHLLALAQTASIELDKVIKAFQMAAPVSEGRALKLAMAEANDKRLEALRTAAPQPAPVQQERMAWVYDTGKGYKIVGYNSAAIAHLDHGTLLVPSVPQPAQKKYRLLEHGDRIESGDTVLDSDSVTWHPLSGWEIGMRWGGNLMPIRRAINANQSIQ